MIVKNDLYDYGLYIYQNSEYFKFSLDSILLAEYVELNDNSLILDMCTGNAPVPLILSTKNPKINIDAVELQKEIYDLAISSVQINNLENIINIHNCNIKDFDTQKKYDIITCNPPYFKCNNESLTNENKIKSIARHEITVNLEEIVNMISKFLKENGEVYIVHRPERLIELINLLENKNIGTRKVTFIYTSENSSAKCFLLKASKNKKTDIKYYYRNVDSLSTYKDIFKEV